MAAASGSAAGAASPADMAQKTFDLENRMQAMDDASIYRYSEEEQEAIFQKKPWKDNPKFFHSVRISAVALIKMVMHARSSGNGILGEMNEVMGLMMGRVTPDGVFIILDAFPLPVEGTETRVNAGASANEFMVAFTEDNESVGKAEHVCGWYHSHPGYGCWLSGIDVQSQATYQHQDPWLAVVIDPVRTCATGKVEIGAFRTFPEGYVAPDDGPGAYQSIPIDKIEDFGVHCKSYYQLPVEFFKNSMDSTLLELLWNKYWIDTLSSSPLLHNREFTNKMVQDCVQKLEQIDTASISQSRYRMVVPEPSKRKDENPLCKVAIDATKLAGEQVQGLTNQVVKFSLFHRCNCRPKPSSSAMEN